MKMFKAKVLATGEEIVVTEYEYKPGVYTTLPGSTVYKADELEILKDMGPESDLALGGIPQMPKYEPLDTTAMLKDMMDSMKGHFWRDQRVEIAKILLQSPLAEPRKVAELADEIVQKLKSYGD